MANEWRTYPEHTKNLFVQVYSTWFNTIAANKIAVVVQEYLPFIWLHVQQIEL